MPKRGVPLTDDQKAAIASWFTKLKNPAPAAIARRIGRDAGTVKWHMLTNGMYHKKVGRAPHEYVRVRNGKEITIHPWDQDHDAFIQEHRATGLSCSEIAKAVTAKFGIERKGHSVRVRLVLLAVGQDESEEAA